MNYLTQISQISQMFYSKDSGILGFKKTGENPCLCCMLYEHSLWQPVKYLCKQASPSLCLTVIDSLWLCSTGKKNRNHNATRS